MPPGVSSASAPVIVVESTVSSSNSDILPSPASSPLIVLDGDTPPPATDTASTSKPASNREDDDEGLAVGPVVGIVCGAIFLLIMLATVFWLYRKQRKQRHANRRSGLLWPERRDTVGSMAVFSGLNMSFASIRHSSPIYVDDNVRSKQIEDEQEKGTEQGTGRRVPKLTLIGGPVSSNGSNQAGPFCPRTTKSSNEPTTQGLETVLHVPPEQLRYLQELLLTKGPGSITSADGERFLTAQAQNDPRLKAWLDSALQAHYSNSSTKSDPPYNVKVDALVDLLGLRTPSKGASRTASDDGHSISS